MKILHFVLALSLFSCGQGRTYHVDDAFTPDERAEIKAAAVDMVSHTGMDQPELVFDGDTSSGTQRFVKATPPGDGTGAELDGRFLWVPGDERAIYLRPGMDPTRFGRVVRHELGHLASLDHHDGPGLMDPNSSTDWNEADEAACRQQGVCKP